VSEFGLVVLVLRAVRTVTVVPADTGQGSWVAIMSIGRVKQAVNESPLRRPPGERQRRPVAGCE
jgi:hypothetical protein